MKKYLLIIVLSKLTLLCSAQLSIGLDYMLSVSYNDTDGSIPIRPSQKRFAHLKYIKNNLNLEAVAGLNFYETVNRNNRISRNYYEDFGLCVGFNMINNEKYVLLYNIGAYHRVFLNEDFATSKKPRRWGAMGLIGYQIKLENRGSTGLHFRFSRDLIRNIKRDDQYNIQHFGLSFFMEANLAVLRDAFKIMFKKRKEKNRIKKKNQLSRFEIATQKQQYL